MLRKVLSVICFVRRASDEWRRKVKIVMSDLISRSGLREEAESLRVTVTGLRSGKGILAEYAKQYRESFLKMIDEQPTVEAKPVDEIHKLSESEFITFILSTICDYAKTNDYEITDTVKTMGENLVALTEICTFDNWKAGADMRGGKND